jgi:hypothetical protein
VDADTRFECLSYFKLFKFQILSYLENLASNSIYFNYHDAFELNTHGEGSEIDDILLFGIKREIEGIHDVPKLYIVNVSDY